MSYCFDTLMQAWARIRVQLPDEAQSSEVTLRFEFLLQEMHEANHRARDVINHDERVTKFARKLDSVMNDKAAS
jgi:hypothetical protein